MNLARAPRVGRGAERAAARAQRLARALELELLGSRVYPEALMDGDWPDTWGHVSDHGVVTCRYRVRETTVPAAEFGRTLWRGRGRRKRRAMAAAAAGEVDEMGGATAQGAQGPA